MQEWLRKHDVDYSIEELKNLQVLCLDNREIIDLPDTIGDLSNLEKVDIGSNKISKLPESIGKLKNLRALFMDHNPIDVLPFSIKKLKSCRIYLLCEHDELNIVIMLYLTPLLTNKYVINTHVPIQELL